MTRRTGREQLLQFLFPLDSGRWLGFLRIALGIELVAYAVSLRYDWNYLLAGTGQGLISRDLAELALSSQSHFVPRLGWFITLGQHAGLREQSLLNATWFALAGTGICLALGLYSRTAAILAWLLHLVSVKSGNLLSYGVDNFTTIGFFYLMLSPLPGRFSLDQILRKRPRKNPQLLGFWRRVLQLHLCLIYFFGGVSKALGSGWWNGTNLWRALIRPPFNVIAPEILLRWKALFPVIGISVCLLEIGYAFLIWGKWTRPVWLIGIVAMHLAIGLAMGMYLFAFIMITLNLSAFGLWRSRVPHDAAGSRLDCRPESRRLPCRVNRDG
jgi:Vitamin K-dependent gamma-carboxylase